jgi:hypothetical protein
LRGALIGLALAGGMLLLAAALLVQKGLLQAQMGQLEVYEDQAAALQSELLGRRLQEIAASDDATARCNVAAVALAAARKVTVPVQAPAAAGGASIASSPGGDTTPAASFGSLSSAQTASLVAVLNAAKPRRLRMGAPVWEPLVWTRLPAALGLPASLHARLVPPDVVAAAASLAGRKQSSKGEPLPAASPVAGGGGGGSLTATSPSSSLPFLRAYLAARTHVFDAVRRGLTSLPSAPPSRGGVATAPDAAGAAAAAPVTETHGPAAPPASHRRVHDMFLALAHELGRWPPASVVARAGDAASVAPAGGSVIASRGRGRVIAR